MTCFHSVSSDTQRPLLPVRGSLKRYRYYYIYLTPSTPHPPPSTLHPLTLHPSTPSPLHPLTLHPPPPSLQRTKEGEKELFHFSDDVPPILLILDRHDNPITPLLNQVPSHSPHQPSTLPHTLPHPPHTHSPHSGPINHGTLIMALIITELTSLK